MVCIPAIYHPVYYPHIPPGVLPAYTTRCTYALILPGVHMPSYYPVLYLRPCYPVLYLRPCYPVSFLHRMWHFLHRMWHFLLQNMTVLSLFAIRNRSRATRSGAWGLSDIKDHLWPFWQESVGLGGQGPGVGEVQRGAQRCQKV